MENKPKTLESIVPSLDLCTQIPKGCFEDSALVWEKHIAPIDGREMPPHVVPKGNAITIRVLAPAPTLEEILCELDAMGFYCPTAYYQANTWQVYCEDDSVDEEADPCPCIHDAEDKDSAVTAALRLWLELNKESKDFCREYEVEYLDPEDFKKGGER